jgi:iron complex outermembrane receptor protein
MKTKTRFASMIASLLVILTSLSTGQAFAQEGAIEEVVVTGSRITRSNFESASPLDMVTAEDLSATSVVSVDEYLKRLPTFSNYQQDSNVNNGGDGGKFVNIRGLGFKRTLVLINGRRTVGSFFGGSSSDLGAVDLNTIAMPMVQRVEVLKDGASAVYGSDALAGVINIITDHDFEGVSFQADGSWGSDEWDAETNTLSMMLGTVGDRGSAQMSLVYATQDELLQGERSWAKDALWPIQQPDGSFKSEALGSSNSRRITTASYFDDAAKALLPADATQFVVDADSGQVRPFESGDTYNYAPINALVTPNKRYQIAAQAEYEIADGISAFGEASFTRRTSHQRLAPDASFAVINDFAGPCDGAGASTCWNDFVPASNPFNPFGDNPNNPYGISGQGVRVNRRFEESGGRLFSQTSDSFRMLAGLRGSIQDAIDWEASYIYADGDNVTETNFYHRFDRWATIVDPNACAQDSACVAATGPENAMNPFGPFGTISADEINYLMANSLKDVYRNRMQDFTLNFSGEAFQLPGGAMGWSAGYEWRKESASFIPDEFIGGGLTTGGAADPLKGSYSVNEIYAEALFPLIADAPLVQSLELETAIRYSDYDTAAGSTTNGKIGANWQINDAFRVRSVYATGFRAPNVVEQVAGQSTTFPIVEFPCEFYNIRDDATPESQANCAAAGIPPDFELGFQWQSAYTLDPDPDMQPEESETWTFGVVWTPEMLEGLRVSLDWWDYKIDGFIDAPDFNGLIRNCLNAPDQTQSLACTYFYGPDGIAGTNDGTGVFPGDVVPDDAESAYGNLGKVDTSGLDIAADYARPVEWGAITLFELNFVATYLDQYKETFPGSGTVDLKGTAGDEDGFGVFPEWRWNATAGVSGESWNVAYTLRWIDSAKDLLRPANITDAPKADSILYQDLMASYTWRQATFSLGIENLADEDPPRFHSAFNANTAPGVYDVIGRRLWARVKFTL